MNEAINPMRGSNPPLPILWLEDVPRRPACDVPWMGNTVVLANGDVNFCCFSGAVVGNVNQTPLKEIWNNDTMRRIRRSLRDQTLPAECRSPSCPIYRGDDNHIILTRMDGAYREQLTGTSDPHAAIRAGFADSRLRMPDVARPTEGPIIEVALHYTGRPVSADVYLAIRGADRVVRFLPRLEAVPLPYRVGIRLPADAPLSLRWAATADWQPGTYDVCSAVFESGSHPNVASNCYWFETARLHDAEARA